MPKFYKNHRTRIIIYMLMLLLLGSYWFNMYRVKSINSLFGLGVERAKSVEIHNGENTYGRTINEKLVSEMIEFLKPLKIKRIRGDNEIKDQSERDKYHITLFGDELRKDFLGGITIYKNNNEIIGDGTHYYRITNDKIEIEFIEHFWESISEKYGDN